LFCGFKLGNPAGGPSNVDYLVVAGGGGGATTGAPGGGGGAGGYRESHSTPVSGCYHSFSFSNTNRYNQLTATTYPITVGGGGAGTPGGHLMVTMDQIQFFKYNTSGGWWMMVLKWNSRRIRWWGYLGLLIHGGAGNTPPVSPSQGNTGGGVDGPVQQYKRWWWWWSTAAGATWRSYSW
jgi:hypothetical protein